MPTSTVTIDVADFATGGPTPQLAFATFARATPDSTGALLVTSAPISVRLVDGHGTVQLEQGVVYRVRFFGVAGLEAPFWAATTTDCTAAQLRQSHQVDPATLQPPVPTSTVGSLLAGLDGRTTALEQHTAIAVAGDGTATIG